jgi:hypothetical protein
VALGELFPPALLEKAGWIGVEAGEGVQSTLEDVPAPGGGALASTNQVVCAFAIVDVRRAARTRPLVGLGSRNRITRNLLEWGCGLRGGPSPLPSRARRGQRTRIAVPR